jgi:adenylate cyclase
VQARAIIAAVLNALHEVAQRHGGTLVKTIGDEIMCTFPGAVQGLLASTDMQRRIKSEPAFVEDNIGIRIGPASRRGAG